MPATVLEHPKPPGRPCQHKLYKLSCEEFDELQRRAAGVCEICRTSADETPQRMLHIDHDYRVGQWAVRGLVCSRCNTSIERGLVRHPGLPSYLANPFYAVLLAAAGFDSPDMPEPPMGTRLVGRGRLLVERTGDGWFYQRSHSSLERGQTVPWRRVLSAYSPHHLRVVA